ncbi:uncharacterized protein LOC119688593 [Teleopsis dalmanni]|uniref:uncharacterized protein LOC119688593 n=1 Tax=Teleopsis dalmanni TaxID=139649 RepID=UPI0018CD5837|nr:uncharacterized protein LOC119688593 [Teleopsis dalmanni]
MFLLAYRSARHNSTSTTPARAVFGADIRLPPDLKFGITPLCGKMTCDYTGSKRDQLDEIHRFIRRRLLLTSDKMKARYDLRMNSEGFQEGDLVWFHNPQRKKGLSPKLQTYWQGPYRVITKINDVVYRIQESGHPRARMKVVHLERLAPYCNDVVVPVRDEQI